jgi:hypothetical protein
MELLGYVVESEAMPTPMQISHLRSFCRREQKILLDVRVEKAVDASQPFLSRPVGSELHHSVAERRVEGMAVLRMDLAFPAELALRPLQCALWTLGWPIVAAEDSPEPPDAGGNGRWPSRTRAAPYGCLRIGRKLYRNPWTWPQREQIVALRRALGLDYPQLSAALRQLGLRGANASFAWPATSLSETVRQHAALRAMAIRDARTVDDYLSVESPGDRASHGVREPAPPAYNARPERQIGRYGAWLELLDTGLFRLMVEEPVAAS